MPLGQVGNRPINPRRLLSSLENTVPPVNPLLKALQPYQAKLDRDLVVSMHQQEKSAVIGHSLVALVVFLLLKSVVPMAILAIWLSTIVSLLACRGYRAWKVLQMEEIGAAHRSLYWWHFALVVGGGLAWSSGFLAAMPYLETAERAIIAMVLSALCFGAVITLSARSATFLAFSLAIIMPAGIGLALQGTSLERVLAGLCGASFAFALASSKKARILLWSHLLQRYRNEDAVRDLAAAKASMTEALQKSEAANQAKREFLTNMSHEVRTPMNGILGTAELLAQGELLEDQRSLLELLQSSGKDLLAILDDVLDLSKIEADRFEFVKENFELSEVLDDVANLHALTADEAGLQFIYDVPLDMPSKAVGDPVRLKQLIHNLLDNAVKFTKRGAVSLKARMKQGGPSGNLLVLEVRDQGKGIPQNQIEVIFQSFTQADGSTTRVHGGTGLGLTITRRLVDLMDGRIEVDSQTDVGTAFHIEIPVRIDEELRPASAKGNVLIAARADHGIHNLARRLKRIGLTVRTLRPQVQLAQECQEFLKDGGYLFVDPTVQEYGTVSEIMTMVHPLKAELILLSRKEDAPEADSNLRHIGLPYPVLELRDLFWKGTPERKATAARSAPSTEGTLAKMNILVAEDNPTNARIAKRMLEQFGMHVDLATNGQEAVDSFKTLHQDLIFMDIQMPVLDGMEATQLIRELPGGREVPILALTAHAMKGYRSKCLDAGMNDYYTKPLRKMDLQEALLKWQSLAQQKKSA
jgi:signal transduction histidine kinase/ActR/RegA family two-component response regulator